MKNKITLFILLTVMAAVHIGAEPAKGVSTADINFQDQDGKTALHRAVIARDLEKVKELLAQGANPNIKDKNGISSFAYSVFGNRNEVIIEELLAHGASIDFLHEHTILSLISLDDYEGVLLLLNCGLNVDYQDDKNDVTALSYAAGFNKLQIVKELLARGANPNIQTKDGYTALVFALAKNHPAVVRELLAHGADQSMRGDFPFSLLVASLLSGRFLSFLELLKYKLWKKPIKMQIIK